MTRRIPPAAPDVTGAPEAAGKQAPGVPAGFHRARVMEIDISQPLPAVARAEHGEPEAALLAVWLCKEPVGMLIVSGPLTPDGLATEIQRELSHLWRALLPEHHLANTALTAAGFEHASCPLATAFDLAARTGPPVSVVLCTRNRPDSLRRCLESLALTAYSHLQVVVVDNAPADDASEEVCASLRDSIRVDYVRELRPGLSHARNRGVLAAEHDLVAFLDDDERVHPDWLTGLALEFGSDPRLGVVSGLVLPAELRTESQVQFEQYGGHSKGRGFRRVVFDKTHTQHQQSPLFPFPAFGVGANMAFRSQTLRDIDGFDVALGAGTLTGGAEDTAAFTEAMLAGWTMVYAPRAVTWHYHRADEDDMSTQLSGYARGIGAYYTAMLLRDPRRIAVLLRLVLPGLQQLLAVRRNSEPAPDAAHGLESSGSTGSGLKVLPMTTGPLAYLRSRHRARSWRTSSGAIHQG